MRSFDSFDKQSSTLVACFEEGFLRLVAANKHKDTRARAELQLQEVASKGIHCAREATS